MMDKIQLLVIRWMTIDTNWGNFYGYYMQIAATITLSSSSPYTWPRNGLLPINVTGPVKIYGVLVGFDIRASTSAN